MWAGRSHPGWGGGRGGGTGAYYINMGRDVLKGVLFSESIWNEGGWGGGGWGGKGVHNKTIWEGSQMYLSVKGFMSIWKGVGI